MRVQYTSPLSLPALAIDSIRGPAGGVYIVPPGTDRMFERCGPAYIDDPADTGLFRGFDRQTYTSPPAFLLSLPAATLFGYREVTWADRFCSDEAFSDCALERGYLDNLASTDTFPNEDTGLVGSVGGTTFDLPTNRPTRHFAETAVVICSHEPSNYGSFLFRVLPKLHDIKRLGLDDLRVVVWAHTPAFVGLLALAGVPHDRIIQHDTHASTSFDQLIMPSLRNPHGYVDPESHAFFQMLASRVPNRGSGRRLYLSRQGQARRQASTRRMTNEAEVIEAVTALGFEAVEPESMTPEEQVGMFASADMVIGPAGSAMFNVVFCRPGTKVLDIESEPHWIYAHAGLFASCQLEYGLVVGKVDDADPSPVHRRFSVDVPALQDRIARSLIG